MKKVFTLLLLCSCFLCRAQTRGLVNVSVADMKISADYESSTDSQALLGTPVEILDTLGWWYLVGTPDHYSGWVTQRQVTPMSEKRFDEWRGSGRVMVTDWFTVITSSPEKGSPVVGDAVMGSILEICPPGNTDVSTRPRISRRHPGFTRVRLPDGREGYIPAASATPLQEWACSVRASGEGIVAAARQFLGFPYVWGGLSAKGLDCSGLVRMACWMNGLILPRNASAQMSEGEAVDFSQPAGGWDEGSIAPSGASADLLPGDLVMFAKVTPQNPSPRASHVGIYIGEGRFIHSSLMVRINSLTPGRSDTYTSKQVIAVRRIVGHEGEGGIVRICDHPWYFIKKHS